MTYLLESIKDKYPDANLVVLQSYLQTANIEVVAFIESVAQMNMSLPQWKNNILDITQVQALQLVARTVCCMNDHKYNCIDWYNKLKDPKRPTGISEVEFGRQLMLSCKLDPDEMMDLSLEKLKLIFNYFSQCMDIGIENLTGQICVSRYSSTTQLSETNVHLAQVNFISGYMRPSDLIKVDFANKNIGGGVMSYGCCQEEIMLLANPELIGLMSLVNILGPYESLVVSGITQYSKVNHYGFDLQFGGTMYVPNQTIIVLDAIDYRKRISDQYLSVNKNTELQKAINGFMGVGQNQLISTGNWGCGAFAGDYRIKFMIQWIAASITKNSLNYYINQPYIASKLKAIYSQFKDIDQLLYELMEVQISAHIPINNTN